MSGPSNETEAEALALRQVEALEALVELMRVIVNDRTGCLDVMNHTPDDD